MDKADSHRTSFADTGLRLLKYVLRHRRESLICAAILVCHSILAVFSPRVMGYVIDLGIVPGDYRMLLILTALFGAVELLRLWSAVAQALYFARLGQGIMCDLRTDLFRHVLKIPVTGIQQLSAGGITSRLTGDVSALASMFDAAFLRVIERLFTAAAIIAGILILEPLLGMTALVLFPFFILLAFFVTRRLFSAYYYIRQGFEELTVSLSETLRGMLIVRLFGLQKERAANFEKAAAGLAKAQLIPPMSFALLHPAMTIVIAASISILLYRGGYLTIAGDLSPGVLTTLISYMIWIFWPILSIVNQWNVFLQGIVSAGRIFEVLDTGTESQGGSFVPENGSLPAALSFDSVSYSYPGTDNGVRDVSFSLQTGERVGIVGASGSGKSTLVKLIMRFLENDSGKIRFGDREAAEYPVDFVRRRIGFVQQEPFLFHGGLRENIVLWDAGSGRRLDGLFADLPPSVRDLIGRSDARTLSAGEKQMVSFARVLLKRPDIWILDETTASLDPQSEGWLESHLFGAARTETVLIIAHRLSTLRKVDRIIVMHDGRVAEIGTHTELMARDGLYARLYRLQAAA